MSLLPSFNGDVSFFVLPSDHQLLSLLALHVSRSGMMGAFLSQLLSPSDVTRVVFLASGLEGALGSSCSFLPQNQPIPHEALIPLRGKWYLDDNLSTCRYFQLEAGWFEAQQWLCYMWQQVPQSDFKMDLSHNIPKVPFL